MACDAGADSADCGAAPATVGAGEFDCKGPDGAGAVTADRGVVGNGGGTPSFGAGSGLARFDTAEAAGVAPLATLPGLCCFSKTPPMAITATASTAMAAHSARGPRRVTGVNGDVDEPDIVGSNGVAFVSEFMPPI